MATDYPGPDDCRVGPPGVGTAIKVESYIPISITPASVAAASVVEQTFACAGVLVGDLLFVAAYPALGNNTTAIGARAVSNGNVAISFLNPTAGALVPASGSYSIGVVRLA